MEEINGESYHNKILENLERKVAEQKMSPEEVAEIHSLVIKLRQADLNSARKYS